MVDSQYSKLNNPQQIQKTHFVDRFNGASLDERWLISILRGTGNVIVRDDIDEGINIRSDGPQASQLKTKISFGGNRHYSETGSVLIGIFRVIQATLVGAKMGLVNISSDVLNQNFVITTASTAFNITTDDGVTTSGQSGSAYDRFSFQLFRLEITPTTALLHGNGILEVTKTNNLPQARLEPTFQCNSTVTSTQRDMRVRYAEAFNT